VLSSLSAQQTIFLDFDTFTDAVSDDGQDYFYSPAERASITGLLNSKFGPFLVTFTDVEPVSGLFSTVYFNVGLGDSGDIDFQNTKKIDDASIHIPKLLEIATLSAPFASTDVVKASVNIAAHESLHLMGTRHHDSFTPVGFGVPSGSIGGGFDPDYPGPAAAILTGKEFNSLTTSIGFSAAKLLDPGMFVGPRSGVKLLMNTIDADVDSSDSHDPLSPQMLILKTISIPNMLPAAPGDPEVLFFADLVVVEDATIDPMPPPFSSVPDGDYYSFFGKAGDQVTIEVISEIIDYRLSDTFNTKVAVLDPLAGYSPLDYFGSPAINNDERESTDSLILDLVLPYTGMFVVEVFSDTALGSDKFGEYEMLIYRLNRVEVPETGSLVLGGVGIAMALVLRWTRQMPSFLRPSKLLSSRPR
jgi:hypothetical protein